MAKNNLKQLLKALPQEAPLHVIRDIDVQRLKPLAQVLEQENYTLHEVIQCYVAFQDPSRQNKRAEQILNLIKQKQEERKNG